MKKGRPQARLSQRVSSDQRRLVQSLERSIRRPFAFIAECGSGRSRHGQAVEDIAFDAERERVEAGPALMVVVRRALVIVLMIVAGVGAIMPGAIVMLVVAGVPGIVGGEHARSQPGDEADDHEACEKRAHAGFRRSHGGQKFK